MDFPASPAGLLQAIYILIISTEVYSTHAQLYSQIHKERTQNTITTDYQSVHWFDRNALIWNGICPVRGAKKHHMNFKTKPKRM
jgi:hypothetical protein